ncbi:DUF1835 domain-containing protein [Alkalihalobacillus sp. MEB130]|uniref:DUF1835 domain-containing protein n=1 Tax=Alkalihalobacillus sp. MEB130 TaxID=2976704 RepID=UPI0028DD7D49|nr:DUF1835 domain-containing protein [Alkalihalobacillus sp. MEB130]MDT8861203.1 DUF1835 domain-containing protein [Alkalihalobacillus sp. MEB130]
MKNIIQLIDKLTSNEAKSLLLHTVLRLKDIQQFKPSHEKMSKEIDDLLSEITLAHSDEPIMLEDYEAIHLICGESAAGTLRFGLGFEHKVIGFPDYFARGPLWKLQKEEGKNNRFDWLVNHINIPMNYLEDEYNSRIVRTLDEIDSIPINIPINIWTADNANEQTGLRYFLYLLQNKLNDIYIIQTSSEYQRLFSPKEERYPAVHTGEIQPEKLKIIYETKGNVPLTEEVRVNLQREWETLSKTKEVLRVFDNNKLISVKESYYDPLIIQVTRELQRQVGFSSFIQVARIIGEVIDHQTCQVDEAFIEYRIRQLVYDGSFEIKGIPKDMLSYRVRVRENL